MSTANQIDPSSQIEPNLTTIEVFLTTYASPYIHVVSIVPDGFTEGKWFGSDFQDATRWICDENKLGKNLYWTVNQAAPLHKKPQKADIFQATRVHLDDDPKEGWDKQADFERLKALGASAIINSGGGLQAIWNLDKPTSDFETVEALNRSIASQFGEKGTCANIDRIFRIPGTVNYPNAKKRSEGRLLTLATILYESPNSHHSLEDLASSFPPVKRLNSTDLPQQLPQHFRYDHWSEEQIVDAICSDPKGRRLWHGLWQQDFLSQSEADFYLCCRCVEFGRTKARALHLFLRSGLDPGKRNPNRKSKNYAELVVGNAFEKEWSSQAVFAFAEHPAPTLPPASSFSPSVAARPDVPRYPSLVSVASLADKPVPEMRWLVENLIPEGFVTDLSAPGGTGKSYVALQLGMSRATGQSWLGQKTKPGRTIYFAAEDTMDEMHRRVFSIAREMAVQLADAAGLQILPMFGYDALLAKMNKLQLVQAELYDYLLSNMKAAGADLCILDTRSNIFGGNENDRSHVMFFAGLLNRLARENDATVLLISHPSRFGEQSDGQSGSTAWTGAVRSRLVMKRENDVTTLKSEKSNYGPRDTSLKLEYRNGFFACLGNFADPTVILQNEAKAEARFLELLDQCELTGQNISHQRTAVNGAPRFFNSLDPSISPEHFRAAMQRLMTNRRVVLEKYRSNGVERQRLARGSAK